MRKRKNNKLILFIILGVIVLCGIGIGVYFVIDNNKKIVHNGYDYVIIVKKGVLDLTYQEMERELLKLIKL